MESLYLLIPIALIFLALAVRVLFWAVNSGQYDDLNTEGQRILFDDERRPAAAKPGAVTDTSSSDHDGSAGH